MRSVAAALGDRERDATTGGRRRGRNAAETFDGRLLEILPEASIVRDATGIAAFAPAGRARAKAQPIAVVLPRTVGELSAVARLAAEAGVGIDVRGGGSAIETPHWDETGALGAQGHGNGFGHHGDVVAVSLQGLRRIYEIDPVSRLVHVECGISIDALQHALARAGLSLGGLPFSSQTATLGGGLATDADGPLGLGQGTLRNALAGLTVVLPGGRVVQIGHGGLDSPNVDLARLLSSAVSDAVILAAAWLRVRPLAGARAELVFGWPTVRAAIDGVLGAGQWRSGWQSAVVAEAGQLDPKIYQVDTGRADGAIGLVTVEGAGDDLAALAAMARDGLFAHGGRDLARDQAFAATGDQADAYSGLTPVARALAMAQSANGASGAITAGRPAAKGASALASGLHHMAEHRRTEYLWQSHYLLALRSPGAVMIDAAVAPALHAGLADEIADVAPQYEVNVAGLHRALEGYTNWVVSPAGSATDNDGVVGFVRELAARVGQAGGTLAVRHGRLPAELEAAAQSDLISDLEAELIGAVREAGLGVARAGTSAPSHAQLTEMGEV